MLSYIINSKQIILEKNKEFVFRIPVLLKAPECEFQIETVDDIIEGVSSITFGLKSTRSSSIVNVPFFINSSLTQHNLYSINNELTDEYLLISCTSNQAITIALSIIRNKLI